MLPAQVEHPPPEGIVIVGTPGASDDATGVAHDEGQDLKRQLLQIVGGDDSSRLGPGRAAWGALQAGQEVLQLARELVGPASPGTGGLKDLGSAGSR